LGFKGRKRIMPRCGLCDKYFKSNKALHLHEAKVHPELRPKIIKPKKFW